MVTLPGARVLMEPVLKVIINTVLLQKGIGQIIPLLVEEIAGWGDHTVM